MYSWWDYFSNKNNSESLSGTAITYLPAILLGTPSGSSNQPVM